MRKEKKTEIVPMWIWLYENVHMVIILLMLQCGQTVHELLYKALKILNPRVKATFYFTLPNAKTKLKRNASIYSVNQIYFGS